MNKIVFHLSYSVPKNRTPPFWGSLGKKGDVLKSGYNLSKLA